MCVRRSQELVPGRNNVPCDTNATSNFGILAAYGFDTTISALFGEKLTVADSYSTVDFVPAVDIFHAYPIDSPLNVAANKLPVCFIFVASTVFLAGQFPEIEVCWMSMVQHQSTAP